VANRRKVNVRIALGEQLLAQVAALKGEAKRQLATASSHFAQAQAAYSNAALEARRCRRPLAAKRREVSKRMAELGALDAARKDARAQAVDAFERDVGGIPRRGVALSPAVIEALRHAEQLERDDAAVWDPLVRLTAEYESARAKRKSLVPIWEACYGRLLGLARPDATPRP
jgi:hypothetical protein